MSMIQCMAAAQAVSEMQKLQNLQESVMTLALAQFNFFITVMPTINLNKKESDEIITKEVGSAD